MDVSIELVSYQQILDGKAIDRDDFGEFKNAFNPRRRNALLTNPNLDNKEKTMAILSRVDGVVVGHAFFFPTKFKAGKEIWDSCGGSSLYVQDAYRHYGTGADIVMEPIRDKRHKALIYADFSSDGISLYKALKFVHFEMPKMIQPHTSKFIFENYGFKGTKLKIAYGLVDFFLKPFISFSMWRLKRFSKKFSVRRLEIVPKWVDDMVLNDGHKYMEVHDQKWMQWCLENRFGIHTELENYFYGIYDKEDRPIGFFFNKERTHDLPSRNISEMTFGTIMEWGSSNEKELSELDIIKIAAVYFSSNMGAIQYCSLNKNVLSKMKWYGFMHHGYHHIVFKDLTKKLKDAGDAELWRLRYGYSDSIMN